MAPPVHQRRSRHDDRAVRLKRDVTSANGALTFEIVDDGVGFDPATVTSGSGLQNMSDRLEAIGGSLTVHARQGGTRASGRIAIPVP